MAAGAGVASGIGEIVPDGDVTDRADAPWKRWW